MLTLSCRIRFHTDNGPYMLDVVNKVEITRKRSDLTAICHLTLPKNIRWQNAKTCPLRRGDAVEIMLGYDDRLSYVFSGYIREIGVQTPMQLTLEDDMFRLKTIRTHRLAYRNATLEQILADQDIPYPVSVSGETHIGAYRVEADTVALLLEDLHKNGFRFFFTLDNSGLPTLHAGILFDRTAAKRIVVSDTVNLIEDKDLKTQHKDTMHVRVKLTSKTGKNSKTITVEKGDKDQNAKVVSYSLPNKTEAELNTMADQYLKQLKKDGLSGSLTTFGEPQAGLLDHVAVKIDGQRIGIYQVDENEISFGTDGFRQKIKLGLRVD